MICSLLETHEFPDAEKIRNGLLNFINKLFSRFPDCSRGIVQNGWRSPIGDWAHPSYGCAELNTLKTYIAERWKHQKESPALKYQEDWISMPVAIDSREEIKQHPSINLFV